MKAVQQHGRSLRWASDVLRRDHEVLGAWVSNEKSAQRPKFSAGRPCGHPAKNFGQALQIMEKN